MRIFLIGILLWFGQNLYAQNMQGNVKDAEVGKPIEFASVYYKIKNSGVYTDLNGNFKFNQIPNDTLIISALGYKKIEIPSSDLSSFLKIEMEPLVFQLENVEFFNNVSRSIGNKKIDIGNLSRDKSTLISGIKGRTVALYVQPKNLKIGQITALKFGISSIQEAMVKVHLFNVDPDTGEPGEEIFLEKNIIKVKNGQNKLHYKLENQKIFIDNNGVFVALEWLGNADFTQTSNITNPYYTSSKSKSAGQIYTRFMEKDWEQYLVSYTAANSKKEKKEGPGVYFHEPNFKITLKY